ncbi:MAG: beta-ketoacyl synthase [Flavobacterium sp.]|nr:beta-ketoacyl synthase [Flavobacterium sp.]
MQTPVSITALASVSPLGHCPEEIWQAYLLPSHHLDVVVLGKRKVHAGIMAVDTQNWVNRLREEQAHYQSLDPTVINAIAVAREAVVQAQWNKDSSFGVNFGSSRGATTLFEQYHADFLQNQSAHILSSPTTTLGNISSWIAQDLQTQGPELSHSITCSTGFHALLNGIAWLRAGMANQFLIGASEAPLTEFTVAQMQAMKIYARENQDFPCRAMDLVKTTNSMVLGEGAVACCLELGIKSNALARIEGIGYATEKLEHNVSITAEADCFQKSMQMAMQGHDPDSIDVIVLHAPGTLKGDSAEYKAIQKVFGKTLPLLTSNKWKIGHSLGASGLLSLELAVMMIQQQVFISVPYLPANPVQKPLQKILINSVGFGGNAVSVLVSKP